MLVDCDLFKGIIKSDEGQVSARCAVRTDENVIHILLDEELIYSYQKTDEESKRMAWVNVYSKGYVTYKQAAKGAGVSETAVKNWMSDYRKKGLAGLVAKPRSGRPIEISEDTIELIVKLREERNSLNKIAQLCNCSKTQVYNILERTKKEELFKTPDLVLDIEDNSTSPNKHLEQADVAKESTGNPVSTPEEIVEDCQNSNVSITTETSDNLVEMLNKPILLCDEIEEVRAKDRSLERTAARLGRLYDAPPLFSSNNHMEFAGMFMAFAILTSDPFIATGLKMLKPLGPSFYGLRTMLMTMVTLALLRIKRPEHLQEVNSEKVGHILGLDKCIGVDRLRQKLRLLSTSKETIDFMEKMGELRAKEAGGDASTIFVDGHTIAYFGNKKVGSTWSARDSKVLKAHTENWVNLPGKAPLFSLETPFNNGLISSLADVLKKTREIMKVDKLTCCFDRGGSSALLFEHLTNEGFGIITYQKGNYKKIDEDKFEKKDIQLGVKTYNYLPLEQEIEIAVFEKEDQGKSKRSRRIDTKRKIKMRDIRVLCKDGHQVSILANHHVKESAEEIADTIFQRIGSQENIFKYMRKEFDIDGLISHKFESVDENVYHPNPEYIKLEKQISKNNSRIKVILTKVADLILFKEECTLAKIREKISAETAFEIYEKMQTSKHSKKSAMAVLENMSIPTKVKTDYAFKISKSMKKVKVETAEEAKQILDNAIETKKQTAQSLFEKINDLKRTPEIEEVHRLKTEIDGFRDKLKDIDFTENANEAGYLKPQEEPKRLMNIVKMAAYCIETKLLDILSKYYSNHDNEGRSILQAALKSTGSIQLHSGELVIKLETQASPRRTRAINELLKELNARQAKFPGSARVIRFEETPHEDWGNSQP